MTDFHDTREVIQIMVKKLIAEYAPLRMILFGSHAYGFPGPDSDIDLLAVGNCVEPKPLRALELKGLLSSLAVPIDLHLRTPEELDTERHQPFSLIETTVRYGILLCEPGA